MRAGDGAILLFLFTILSVFAYGQTRSNTVAELYRYVEQADSLVVYGQRTFYLEKFLEDDYTYRETWRYAEREGRIFYFQVDYILDSLEHMEAYYMDRGGLVCAEEYEKMNYSFTEDELRFGSIFYFQQNLPRHIAILGRKSQPAGILSPELDVLTRFHKRYTELRRHIPMLVP